MVIRQVESHRNWKFFLSVIVLIAIFPVFYSLSTLPIRLFDESRLANSALEMNRNHNLLIPQYKGEPEMWSVKPPLMIWTQVFCMKIFGENELAVRLPAALCGLLTILLTFLFVSKVTNKPHFGFMAALVLLATSGYITEHGTRTGDYDSMLVLFLMLQLVSFYLFLEDTNRKFYWYLTCSGVILAAYTKGIAGFMFLPGLFLIALLNKKIIMIIRSRETWIGILLTAILIFGYYGIREVYNQGYIKKVIENEITYRYFDVNEGHVGDWNFYLEYLSQTGYSSWYLFAIVGTIFGFISKQNSFNKLIKYTAINALAFLIVISNSETKIVWYALPLFPLMGILSAGCFLYLYEFISLKFSGKFDHLKWIPLVVFAGLFANNYIHIMNQVYKPAELDREEYIYSLSYVFQSASRGKTNLDGVYYIYEPYNAHLNFYLEVLSKKGQVITLVDKEKLKAGNKVLSGNPDITGYITTHYNCVTIESWNNNVQLLEIK